ncbi:hypothetical protein X777_06213 [Ooceraea biroi]|uniref:Uncharacterized protein n=1 Tax=Ooceraea biroi TaxID=2015173 RepID=A0A026WAR4_OOCBI|nr:hypothetical protein X777_06213 [Ooceraea biroi]
MLPILIANIKYRSDSSIVGLLGESRIECQKSKKCGINTARQIIKDKTSMKRLDNLSCR